MAQQVSSLGTLNALYHCLVPRRALYSIVVVLVRAVHALALALHVRTRERISATATPAAHDGDIPGPQPDRPHQLGSCFNFPKRSFGQKKAVLRSFQSSWFGQWPFLHYDEAKDAGPRFVTPA